MKGASTPLLAPQPIETDNDRGRYMVEIFNNDHTPFDTVVAILMEATGCDVEEAAMEAWEAHTFGQTPVHFAGEQKCLRVASVISSVGVRSEVRKEWDD